LKKCWATKADFTYSITPDAISIIQGQGIGEKRHRNCLEEDRVLSSRIDCWVPDPYRDEYGGWNAVRWEGQSASFTALGETDEKRATAKLLRL